MNKQAEGATPADTRAEILRLSARGYTQIRHILVQLPDRDKPRASTLARMMHGRRHRALLLYLLVLTCAPWLKDQHEPLQGAVWVRALTAKGAPTWSESTLSRAWNDLVELGLVEKTRENRLVRITPRREDGAASYDPPGGRSDRYNAYFTVPDDFWTKEVFAELSLPGLVMFLVVAKETSNTSDVWLAYNRADEWYGIKPKSAQNGLDELVRLGYATRSAQTVPAPLSPTGNTVRLRYALTGPFGHKARKTLQARAAKATKNRQKTAKISPSNPNPTQGPET
ncbi:ArsR family transcriptional regulator [Clavibacter capsici]|uniref:ArsR family transcriptional regulator n=1 Tax=Clavibacter capsici TaxID=1874630 RepID=UPI001427F986|nr:ArsR family transcriptional regulator [Clavibacter capsici]QIS43154.1 ArsR family transcriptional regulator [Clavibacter capsici]